MEMDGPMAHMSIQATQRSVGLGEKIQRKSKNPKQMAGETAQLIKGLPSAMKT